MNKHTKILFALICVIAISSLCFVDAAATWKSFKQCNMVYWTSNDPTTYGVAGNQINTFKLTLDNNPNTWYYLNIKNIKPTITVDPKYSSEVFGFFLDQASVADNQAFKDYWDAKLAAAQGQPWVPLMDAIIHGNAPMFMLKVTPTGQYMLVDYLQFAMQLFSTGDFQYNPLRINGDYPHGTYTFVCEMPAIGIYPDNSYENILNPISNVAMTITFK